MLSSFCDNKEDCFYFNPVNYFKYESPSDVFMIKNNKINYGHYNSKISEIVLKELYNFCENIVTSSEMSSN